MTDYSKLTDSEINQHVGNSIYVGTHHHAPTKSEGRIINNYVSDNDVCMQLIKENQISITMNNLPIQELWIAESFACDGELRGTTNPNLNRAILECYLQIAKSE